MDIYKQNIIDHYKNPRNFGHIKGKAISSFEENPSCGDRISMDVSFKNNSIYDIKFSGEGCAISIASASILTDKVKGKKLTEIADIEFPEIQKMLGITITHARMACAMLPLHVLKKIVLKELKNLNKK